MNSKLLHIRFLKTNYTIYIIIFLVFGISNYLSYKLSAIGYSTDSYLYVGIANGILHGKSVVYLPEALWYPDNGKDIGEMVMPGYSAFIAIIFFVFGNNHWNIIIFHLALALIASYAFLSITHYILKNKILALIVTCWQIIYIELWHYNFQVLLESTTASILIISLYFLCNYLKNNKILNLYVYSLISAVLISFNNRFIAHVFFAFIVLLIWNFIYKKKQVQNILIGGSIIFIFLLPWHIRQFLTYNKIVLFTPVRTDFASGKIQSIHAEYETYNDYYKSLTQNDILHADNDIYIKKFTPKKLEQMEKINSSNLKHPFVSRFLGFFEIIRTDFRFGFGNDTRITPPNIYGAKQQIRLICNILFLGTMLILMFAGAYFAFFKRNVFMIILSFYTVSHVLLHSWTHYIERYRLTIVPVIIILGWYGIKEIYLIFKKKCTVESA